MAGNARYICRTHLPIKCVLLCPRRLAMQPFLKVTQPVDMRQGVISYSAAYTSMLSLEDMASRSTKAFISVRILTDTCIIHRFEWAQENSPPQ